MKYDLVARTKAWVELFAKRGDLAFRSQPLWGDAPAKASPMPADLAAFAKHADRLELAYTLPAPRPEPNRGDPDGYLFLAFDGARTGVYLDIPNKGTFEGAIELEYDSLGTGQAGFYVTDGAEPFIVWSVEDHVLYPSLEAYLTAGAKQAFLHVFPGSLSSWHYHVGKPNPLLASSLPKSTPVADLKTALVGRAVAPDMADDLVEWLGSDVVLLLPK